MQQHSCIDELKAAELKVTPARLAVLAVLEKTTIPLDVTTLRERLKKNNIKADKVTVFRIINTLSDKGLARPIQFNEGKLRYEHSARADHHHFVCERCGEVEDIADCNIVQIEDTIKREKGVIIQRHSLEFFGLCRDCQN